MNSTTKFAQLFSPIQMGSLTLKNRIIMSALNRQRCDKTTAIPNDLLVKYYTQRAGVGLIITECAPVSQRSVASPGSAGIWNDDQMEGWKKVTESVHRAEGIIFMQIWHSGRATHSKLNGGLEPWAPSPIAIRTKNVKANLPHEIPHEMTIDEIKQVIEEFRAGAIRAKQAGFDGVELHGGHGYLIDEFLRANQRTDEYGGSVQNKARFCLEVLDALISVFGSDRVGIKVTPTGHYNDVYADNVVELYTHLFKEFEKRKIAFVELKQDRDLENWEGYGYPASLNQIPNVYETFRPHYTGILVGNNQFTPERAEIDIGEKRIDMVAFGRFMISNPDLPQRLQNNRELSPWDESTFEGGDERGYTDYLIWEEMNQ